MVEAMFYKQISENKVKCFLCPHECLITEGNYGNCMGRINIEGKLYSEIYGKVVAANLDPIEKKPLYHFYSGSMILSVGTAGCNFHCKFCQNHDISQHRVWDVFGVRDFSPEELVEAAGSRSDNLGIAFTYNEPFIWFEYVLEASKLAKKVGLKTVMVTNGYVNKKPLEMLNPYIDAYSIDIKSYDNRLYKELTGAEIGTVLENTAYIISTGKHVEIDYLVIPGYNDDLDKFRAFMKYYKEHFGGETVLHINRYFPRYKMKLEASPVETLHNMKAVALEYIKFVYLGNV